MIAGTTIYQTTCHHILEDHFLASYKNQNLTVFEWFDQNKIYIDG